MLPKQRYLLCCRSSQITHVKIEYCLVIIGLSVMAGYFRFAGSVGLIIHFELLRVFE
jgi:hypothetical protein